MFKHILHAQIAVPSELRVDFNDLMIRGSNDPR
jgi:hypothetical protein